MPVASTATIPEISIVIPAYNEARRLPATLDQVEDYIAVRGIDAEVIVVDDGSQDATARLVAERMERCAVLRLVSASCNRGVGSAVQLGMAAARGRYRIFSDADLSVPISDLEVVVAPLRNGAAVSIASRRLTNSEITVHQPWYRELLGRLFNLLVRIFVMGGIADTQCGFKAFTAEAADVLFPLLETRGFGFDVELLYRAKLRGYAIAEVPARWTNSQESKVTIAKGLRAFLDVVVVRRRVRRSLSRIPPTGRSEASLAREWSELEAERPPAFRTGVV